jgi:hypothetical protein
MADDDDDPSFHPFSFFFFFHFFPPRAVHPFSFFQRARALLLLRFHPSLFTLTPPSFLPPCDVAPLVFHSSKSRER